MLNSWMVLAPFACIVVWFFTYFYRKELATYPRARKYGRRAVSVFCGTLLLVLLHLESHRGGVQLMRNWGNDPSGNYDLEHALVTSAVFVLVAVFYAYLMSAGIERIVEGFIRKTAAKHLADGGRNSQPDQQSTDEPLFWTVDGTRPDAQPTANTAKSCLIKPILTIKESSAYSLGSLARALQPGQQRIYEIPCKQRYAGKYELTEEEYLFLMMTLPHELWGKIEIEDLEPEQ